MRRRISYANVTATLALVFAMSGGALAANHYLITSTKQISPKVLKSLKGKNGAAGKIGATGAAGPTGASGPQGKEGPQGLTGPSTGPAGGALTGAYPNPTLASGSVTTSNFAAGAEAPIAANAESLGGTPASGYQTAAHWALVDKGGTIVSQSGGISVVSHTSGEYILDFGFSVVGHPILVTQSTRDNSFVGGVSTAPCGTTTESYPNCGGDPTTDVFVGTEDSADTGVSERSFYIVVL